MSRRFRVIAGRSPTGSGQELPAWAQAERERVELRAKVREIWNELCPRAHERIRWTEISHDELWAIVDHAEAERRRRSEAKRPPNLIEDLRAHLREKEDDRE